jgi:flagellar motor switch/type III secretory pathway protein FliN
MIALDRGLHMTQGLLPAESAPSEAVVATLTAEDQWRPLTWLPCDLTLELPVAHFSVRDLLQLKVGTVVETCCSRGAEIPLRVNGELIGWAEFEPVADHIGVRVTELT